MKSVHNCLLCVVALAVLAATATAAAQERPLLNTLEVQQLVARGEPSDNARLGVHFAALGDMYAAEANRHIAMSKSFATNPNRSFAASMSVHCTRLADLNAQSAATVRALATYHEKLSNGLMPTPPRDAARFQAGAGAPEPTAKELNAIAAKARTTSDHRSLEEYFMMLARRYTNEAKEHTALAQAYRGSRLAQAAVHQDRLAELAREEAKEATDAAEMHKGLADVAR